MAKIKNQPGAHGLTAKDRREIHRKQANGDDLEMIPANGANAPEGFKIRKDEAHLVIVELEVKNFDQATGEKKSKPYIQKFGVKEFESMKESGAFAGVSVMILHSPKDAAEELGSATEGARSVDSNYAAMQDKYEALTKQRPPADWSPEMLDSANRTAEVLHAAFQANGGQPLQPISDGQVAPNTPPVVLGTPAALSLASDKPVTSTEEIAAAATAAAENTAPTADGTTSVGQETEPTGKPDAAAQRTGDEKPKAAAPDEEAEEPAKGGRRGAAPKVTATAKAALAAKTDEQKAAVKVAPAARE